MSADTRLAVTKHTRTFGFQLVAGRQNIGYFVADVMDATRRIARQELADRTTFAHWVQQFDFRIGQFHENNGDTVRRLIERSRYRGAKRISIESGRLVESGYDDCHLVEFADHGSPLVLLLPVNIAGQGTPIAEPDGLQ